MDGMSSSWYIPVLTIVDQQLLNIYSPVMVKLNGARSPQAVVGVFNDPEIEDDCLQVYIITIEI